jgi:hypothetical protein
MPTYSISFCGRRVGAIGIMQQFTEQATGDNPDAALLSLYDRFEHVFSPKITLLIPWLVQIAREGETHCGREWQTIEAETSTAAALAWLERNNHHLPIRMRVAPGASILWHATGVPMISREFSIAAAESEVRS